MARVILRFVGKGQPPETDVAQIQSTPGLHVVDQSSRMLLVEADESELREYCRANISRQKVPKYIRFVTAFPMTASGKVKKFELKEQMIKELGLEELAKQKMA